MREYKFKKPHYTIVSKILYAQKKYTLELHITYKFISEVLIPTQSAAQWIENASSHSTIVAST